MGVFPSFTSAAFVCEKQRQPKKRCALSGDGCAVCNGFGSHHEAAQTRRDTPTPPADLDDAMLAGVDHRGFLLGKLPPQKEDHPLTLPVDQADHRVCESLPANRAVGIRFVCPEGKDWVPPRKTYWTVRDALSMKTPCFAHPSRHP